MGRYYFHIRDGRNVIPGEEGMELSDIYAARVEAHASADDLANEAIREGSSVAAWVIEIADEAGNILGRVGMPEHRQLA